jgi:hypothetical protein
MSCQEKLELCTDTKKGGTFPTQKIEYPLGVDGVNQMTAVYRASQVSEKVLPTL